MWQAILLAIGISLCVVGGECLVLEKVVLAHPTLTRQRDDFGALDPVLTTPRRVLVPPEWAPWVLLAGGAIAVLYSHSASSGSEG
jgi:hypothetical protein